MDLSLGEHDLQQMVDEFTAVGITDVFLMAKSPEGVVYFNQQTGVVLADDASDLFGTILQALKKAGFRVHAWLPVNLDVAMALKHPDWAMVADNGVPSQEWLSPTHPEVRNYLFRTITHLLARYNLDGIHLDYIRFPSLGYDFSPTALATFGQDAGMELTGWEATSLFLSTHYMKWTNWRARLISDLVGEVRALISGSGKGQVLLSAALQPQAATSNEVMRWSGQNYGQLADHLDLVMPMAYFQEEQRPVEWIEKIVAASRFNIGARELYVGVPAYRKPGAWDYTTAEFEQALQYAGRGSDGIVLYPYLWLFGLGDPEVETAFTEVEVKIASWKILGHRYLEEACQLGYATLEDGKVSLADEGRQMIIRASEEGYKREF